MRVSGDETVVELQSQGAVERSLRFGRPRQLRSVDAQRSAAIFDPRAVFCVRQKGGGAAIERLLIVRAIAPGQPFSLLPAITPGAEILLDVSGIGRVERALDAIAEIEGRRLRPEAIAPAHWVNLAGRIAAGLPSRAYSRASHLA